jgi:DNA repair photolyase
MQYKQIRVTSLLNKIVTKDSLFSGDYTVDPYQNCEFGCLYCDSSFDKTIYIKSNAVEIIEKELKQSKKGTVIIGSVHDPYQKTEESCKITRELLEKIRTHGFSCHVLTKSDLVLRDIDILSEIRDSRVTISITSLKESIFNVFEKDVPSPDVRLQTIEKLSSAGITAGLAVIPVLPFFVEAELEKMIKLAKKHRAHYLLHKHLELKGDQKEFFLEILEKRYPRLLEKYQKLYKDSYFPDVDYISKINETIAKLCNKYELKNKI